MIIINLDACVVGDDLGVPVEDCVVLLAHEIVVTAGLDKQHEFKLAKLQEDLVFDLCLFRCQLQNEKVFLVEVVLPGVRQNREHVQLSGLIEAKNLDTLIIGKEFFVELCLLQLLILDFAVDQLARISHLEIFLSFHLILDER